MTILEMILLFASLIVLVYLGCLLIKFYGECKYWDGRIDESIDNLKRLNKHDD